ncbi:MAG: tetratricopeptide repeat protein [Candidatus Omnitrophica bacterium]|nr:tetratricopeptide repeat protein [Candidatus Omnitrophota bacterium]
MKFKLTIIIALLAASVSFAQGTEEAEFTFAKKAFSDGFYSLAQENLEDFLHTYPATTHLYEAHLLLGRSLYYQNDLKRSYNEFDIVLSAPNASGFEDSAVYWMGDIYFKGQDYEKALGSYQKILDDYPASKYSGYAVYSKAWAYYKLGFLEDAIMAFGEVVSKYNFEKIGMESMFKIGECEYLLGKAKDAERSLNDYIEKYPLSDRTAESYYLLGDSCFKQGKYSDSIGYFSRAMSISPGAKWYAFALYRTAQGYLNVSNYDESLKRFAECAKSSKNVFLISNSLIGMAVNYRMKGRGEDALKACDDIAARFPKSDAHIEACYIKAKMLNDQKRYKEAEEACLAGIDSFATPEKAGKLYYELGWAYSKRDNDKEALGYLETAIKYLKNEKLVSSALCKAGDIYFEAGDLDKAMERFDAVLNSYAPSPSADYAQFSVGNIFLAEKKYDRAIISFQSAVANFPGSSLREKIMFKLALAYFGKEDYLRAAEEFGKLPGEAARSYLANSLYNMNKYDEALELFREIVKSSADRSIAEYAQYQMGWCYYRMNKDMEAADSFDAFLKKYPDSKFRPDALNQSAAILSTAAQNFEKWKMPDDAARLYKRAEELKRR